MGHTKGACMANIHGTQQDQTTITLTLAAIPILLATLTIVLIPTPFDHPLIWTTKILKATAHPLEFGARKSAQHNLAFA
jgi:hypothetical protein